MLFEHKQHYQSYNARLKVQSKGRYLLLKKRTTTNGWLGLQDITNPKMYINPAPGNTQSMLRRGRVVV